jgi:hypothetical protein
MEQFLETADVARRAGVTPGRIRQEAARGRIETGAITERGSRLFRADAVSRYLAERLKTRRKGTAGGQQP